MPQADPAERVVDGREPGPQPAALLQFGLELGQRDLWRRLDQPPQVGFVGREHGPPVPTGARGRGAAGGSDTLHQLDRGRRTDGEPPRSFPDRAAVLDRTYDPQPQVHGKSVPA
jgi:hypothetical protein